MFIFRKFQKRLQDNFLTIVKMYDAVKNTIELLKNLKTRPILGGCESILESSIKTKDAKMFLKNIE